MPNTSTLSLYNNIITPYHTNSNSINNNNNILISTCRPFSTATSTHESSQSVKLNTNNKKKNQNRPQRKDPITITPSASTRLQELLSSSPSAQKAIGIRLGVKRRGCNGLSYTMNYAFDTQPNEEIMTLDNGIMVMIEPMALFNVVGTVMDWVETDMSSEFTFENPNSKGECGCGESFNV